MQPDDFLFPAVLYDSSCWHDLLTPLCPGQVKTSSGHLLDIVIPVADPPLPLLRIMPNPTSTDAQEFSPKLLFFFFTVPLLASGPHPHSVSCWRSAQWPIAGARLFTLLLFRSNASWLAPPFGSTRAVCSAIPPLLNVKNSVFLLQAGVLQRASNGLLLHCPKFTAHIRWKPHVHSQHKYMLYSYEIIWFGHTRCRAEGPVCQAYSDILSIYMTSSLCYPYIWDSFPSKKYHFLLDLLCIQEWLAGLSRLCSAVRDRLWSPSR